MTNKPQMALLFIIVSILANVSIAKPDEINQGNQLRFIENSVSFDDRYENARFLANSGKRIEAIEAYSKLLEESPGNTDVLLGRGLVYSREGMWDDSEKDFLSAIDRSPGYIDVWIALGNMYSWSDQQEKAINVYSHLIELQPNNVDYYAFRGKTYKKNGKFGPALKDFNVARSLGTEINSVEADIKEIDAMLASDQAKTVAAQDYGWSASFSSGFSDFTPDKGKWQDSSISIRKYFSDGSIGFERLNAERSGDQDHALALDAYISLWSRAYSNLRFQNTSNPSLYPDHSWRVELYQGVSTGWEVSGGYDELSYSETPVRIYSLGLGKYIGNFYFRVRHLLVTSDGGNSSSERILLRYYFTGDADNYFELNASTGRDDDALVIAKGQQNRDSLGIAFVRYPIDRFGYKLGISYSRESNNFSEREISGALYFRW
jgi:hypothetical protein